MDARKHQVLSVHPGTNVTYRHRSAIRSLTVWGREWEGGQSGFWFVFAFLQLVTAAFENGK